MKARDFTRKWEQAFAYCLEIDAFAMEVKNYDQPWLPSAAEALAAPYAAYHRAIAEAVGSKDVFSAVAVQVARQPSINFFIDPSAAGAPTPTRYDLPVDVNAVEVLLRLPQDASEAAGVHLRRWLTNHKKAAIVFAPYVVRRIPEGTSLPSDPRAEYFARNFDPSALLFTRPSVVKRDTGTAAHTALPPHDGTYFASAWLLACANATPSERLLEIARQICLQFQISWGYPALVDRFHAEESKFFEARDEADIIRKAAAVITRGAGYMHMITEAVDSLTRVVDHLSPRVRAFTRAAASVASTLFPTGGPHNIEDHLLLDDSHCRTQLGLLLELLNATIVFNKSSQDGSTDTFHDESVDVIERTRSAIHALMKPPTNYEAHRRALAYAKAFSRMHVFANDLAGADPSWPLLALTSPYPGDGTASYAPQFVVLLEKARRGAFGVRSVSVHRSNAKRPRFSLTLQGVEPVTAAGFERLTNGIKAHWERRKPRDDGDFSWFWAGLLRSLRNSNDITELHDFLQKYFRRDRSGHLTVLVHAQPLERV